MPRPAVASSPVHLFTSASIESLEVAEILHTVQRTGYAAIRGVFPKDEVRAALERFRKHFDASKDHAAMGETLEAVMDNFQKVVIGGGAQRTYYVPRFLRVLYNPIWAADIYGMREIFRRLARLRNHIQGHPPDFAVDRSESGFWTAARLQHYPRGGGFFHTHQDAVASTTSEEAGLLQFIQILLLITERGVDFERGGAFVEKDGRRLDLEVECGSGDVVIYDGRSLHGVDDVDPHLLPDLASANGRVVALATLYTDMRGKPGQLEHYRTRSYGEAHP